MNPSVAAIPGSLIREVAEKKRSTSVDLGLGEPSLMPVAAHLEAGMRYAREFGLRYSANAGMPELREAIARHYDYPGMGAASNVCVTTGSQEAMYVALKTLLNPATDELLVVEPTFPSYVKMAKLEGVAVRGVTMDASDDFAIDAQRIVDAIGERTRAIVICSPNNPTGRVLRRAQAEALVGALQSRGGDPVWVVHDEIYREQTFVEDAAYVADLYPHTVVTNSVSKSNALTGLRLGWVLGPQNFIANAIKAHAWVTSCADSFAQRVAFDIFSTAGGLAEHAAWYAKQRADVVAGLDAARLRYIAPEGSFYACVRLPDGMASLDAALQLIATHDVLAIPGSAFGTAMEGWLRLSWVAPIDRVREGINRIADFIGTKA